MNRVINFVIDHSDTALSWKTLLISFLSGLGAVSYGIFFENAVGFIKLVGAFLMLVPMVMNIIINRRRYGKAIKGLFKNCPDE